MIRELKTLLAISREGTFSAAGEKVGLTQAAVSAQMQRLETELGFALFERSGRSARLNALGHQTVQQAQDIIKLYNGLGSRLIGPPTTIPLSIGAIASAQRNLLTDILSRFHKQHGECRIRVVPGLSMDLVNHVDAGDLDMAVVIRPTFALPADLRWATLVHEPFRLLVPRDVAGDDWAEILSTQPFIRYDRISFGGRQVDRFLQRVHITVQQVFELDELEAIVRLVANGVGVALVPQTALHRSWPAAVRAIHLGNQTFHRDIGLVHRSSKTLGEQARQLASMITTTYQALPVADD
ncbi:MAG: LysR family transcriptional regulator [Burkholderiaceae bacterium]|nr:LysR family transcriptional regulator [Burkholderiaceae bacterium]